MNAIATNISAVSVRRIDYARLAKGCAILALMVIGLLFAFPSQAVDLITMGDATGTALETAATVLQEMGPGIKILVGFIAFVVALISLAALRNFGPVLFFIGVAIFGATGLAVAGTIMGADLAHMALL